MIDQRRVEFLPAPPLNGRPYLRIREYGLYQWTDVGRWVPIHRWYSKWRVLHVDGFERLARLM
jgi:hypothetical protein